MAALNQERFTLATEDTIEVLRNGAKNVNTSRSRLFLAKCSRPTIPSVNPIKRRRVHIIESDSDSD